MLVQIQELAALTGQDHSVAARKTKEGKGGMIFI